MLDQVPEVGGSSQGVPLHLHGACQQCHLYIRDLAVSSNPPPAPARATFLCDDWHIPVDINHQSGIWACFSWFPKNQCVAILPACCSLTSFSLLYQKHGLLVVCSPTTFCSCHPCLVRGAALCHREWLGCAARPRAELQFWRCGRIPTCSKGSGQHCSFLAVPPPQLGLCNSGFVRKLMSFTCPYHVLVLFWTAGQTGLGGRLQGDLKPLGWKWEAGSMRGKQAVCREYARQLTVLWLNLIFRPRNQG